MAKHRHDIIEGTFQHLIYSPHGEVEGVMLEVDNEPVQLVFEHHDSQSPIPFLGLRPGQEIQVSGTAVEPSGKHKATHHVYEFDRLIHVNGEQPAPPRAPETPAYRGKVKRFNYARHGEINGVVLDTGDFIHLKPRGYERFSFKPGDAVEADGDAYRLADDTGWAVEATVVNGKAVDPAH